MSRSIKISKTAEKKISKLLDYLLENWSLKVKSDFVKKLDRSIDLIKSDPHIFPESDKIPGLHKCVVTKQTTFYYKIDLELNSIVVLTLFDTRQDPNELHNQVK